MTKLRFMSAIACLLFCTVQYTPLAGAVRNVINVIPDSQQTALCPSMHTCYTLNKLAQLSNDGHPIHSNTEIILSSGNHPIDSHVLLLIENVHNITFSGHVSNASNQTTLVHCTGKFGLLFRNTTNVSIANVAFDNCVSTPICTNFVFDIVDIRLCYNSTIIAIGCTKFSMHGVTITNTHGIGVLFRNVYGNLVLSYLNLFSNHVGLYIDLGNVEQNTLNPVNISIAHSSVLFGRALGNTYYYNMAAGVNMRLFQQRIDIFIRLVNITLYDNEGDNGNLYMEFMRAKPNVTVFIDRLNSTHARGANENYGFYLRLQPSQIDVLSLKQIYLTMINSCFKQTCAKIYNSAFHNYYGSENRLHRFILINTTIEESDCLSSLSVDNIAEIELHSIHVNNSQGTIMNVLHKTSVIMLGRCIFHGNSGGLSIQHSSLTFRPESVHFSSNIWSSDDLFTAPSEAHRAVLFAESAVLKFEQSVVIFEDNKAPFSGGIMAVNSTLLIMNCTVEFICNEGRNGGAMALYDESVIEVLSTYGVYFNIMFVENNAKEHGGALYISDVGYINIYSREKSTSFLKSEIKGPGAFTFTNNSANLGGNAIFGGWFDLLQPSLRFGAKFTFDETDKDDISLISSFPTRVCLCEDMVPNCNITNHIEWVYPGEAFSLYAVAVGQRFGTTSFVVQARFDDESNEESAPQLLLPSQYVQKVRVNCTSITYTISSASDNETIILIVAKPYYVPQVILDGFPLLFEDLTLTINLKSCPVGFTLDQKLNICTCQSTVVENNICNTTTFRVSRRDPNQWINATFVHRITKEPGVIVHNHCPHSFCTKDKILSLDLEYPDYQCSFNRSGTLCGKCRKNYSQVFGTENCKQCSSLWVLLFIPVFAIAGVLLVGFLLILNLTVTVGTINGLIFYANIVKANQAIFFPPETNNAFLSWFIAWINLDFGIEACFYNGMDAYAKTWLQFLFPLYIWFILIAIILLSRRFDTIAKLCGNNAVPVLATLILLSYAKLLRIIITTFQPTPLNYPDGNYTRVWLYDGNIDYLRGKHIPLFIAALILLVFLSIPYTAILLTIQWLQKLSEHRVLFWVNRLKPLFDAYTGPYKDTHRYWTGLLLLVRVLLFLVFSLNVGNDPSLNLVTISIVVMIMGLYLSMIGGVYKTRVNNLIELSFILNLGVLSVATFYHIHTDKSKREITIASVSIALVTFVFITLKELFGRCFLKNNRNKNKLKSFPKNTNELKLFIEAMFPQSNSVENDDQKTDDTSCDKSSREDKRVTVLTRTSVQLREPLLDYTCEQD